MDCISFHLENLKVPSTNNSRLISWKQKKQFKSAEYNDFDKTISHYCLSKYLDMKEFEKHFDPEKHHLSYRAIFWIPKDKLFTKKDTISARSGDFDNYLKTSTDSIFKNFPTIDDKVIKHVSGIEYLVSDNNKYNFLIKLSLRDNSLLYQLGDV